MIQAKRYQLRTTFLIVLFCVLLFLSMFVVESGYGQESSGSAGEFLRLGVGTRAIAMGSAFSGLADDASATYWNPAGLAQINRFQIEFMNVNLPFDQTMNFFSTVIPLWQFANLGVSWLGLRVGDIEARDGNSSDPDFVFNNSQDAVFFSLGRSIGYHFALGGNVKIIRNRLQGDAATGLGFDAGVLFRPTYFLSVGVMVQDLGTDYRWEGGLTEGVPMTLRVGTAWRVFDGLLVVADVNKTNDSSIRFHLGTELRPVPTLPIRIGFDDKRVTGGAGFELPLSSHSLELNYGYSTDPILSEAIHRVSLVLTFGGGDRYTSTARPAVRRRTSRRSSSGRAQTSNDVVREKDKYVEITARRLNVRTGPGTQFQRITQLLYGEKVIALETNGNWRKIKLGSGRIGWVHSSYVRQL